MKVNIAVCDPDVKSFLRPLLEIPDGEMVQSGRTPEFLARARRPAVVEPRPAVPGLAKPAGGPQLGQRGLNLLLGRGSETGYSFARARQCLIKDSQIERAYQLRATQIFSGRLFRAGLPEEA
jgi:hypothetical protein